jgi:hypothetical protein
MELTQEVVPPDASHGGYEPAGGDLHVPSLAPVAVEIADRRYVPISGRIEEECLALARSAHSTPIRWGDNPGAARSRGRLYRSSQAGLIRKDEVAGFDEV